MSSNRDGYGCMQVSDQCVRLVKAGWFDQQQEPSGVSTLTDPKVSQRPVAPADHLSPMQNILTLQHSHFSKEGMQLLSRNTAAAMPIH